MSSALLMEHSSHVSHGFAGAHPGFQPAALGSGHPAAANWCVLPRCEMKFEKCTGGFKLHCTCDDEVATGTLQNLCRMLSEGLCNCCVTRNGLTVCQCNFTLGHCHCEYTKDGVCLSCTSGDKKCAEMLQACCATLACCCDAGCTCYLSFNSTPVCCGTCSE